LEPVGNDGVTEEVVLRLLAKFPEGDTLLPFGGGILVKTLYVLFPTIPK